MALDDGDPHRLAANMSCTIEPDLSLCSVGFGLKLGATALRTETGPQSLARLSHVLIVVD